LGNPARLRSLDTAEHGYKIQKRIPPQKEDFLDEMARGAAQRAANL